MRRAPIKELPPREELLRLLHYDPETGLLRWRLAILSSKVRAGDASGTVTAQGYLAIGIRRRQFLAHRIIWKMMTGEEPSFQIDHKDTDRLNNRWLNLRRADNGSNRWNSKRAKNNRSGVKGVCYVRTHKAWKAYIGTGKRQIRLGNFKSFDDAVAARQAAAEILHGDFTRHD